MNLATLRAAVTVRLVLGDTPVYGVFTGDPVGLVSAFIAIKWQECTPWMWECRLPALERRLVGMIVRYSK